MPPRRKAIGKGTKRKRDPDKSSTTHGRSSKRKKRGGKQPASPDSADGSKYGLSEAKAQTPPSGGPSPSAQTQCPPAPQIGRMTRQRSRSKAEASSFISPGTQSFQDLKTKVEMVDKLSDKNKRKRLTIAEACQRHKLDIQKYYRYMRS